MKQLPHNSTPILPRLEPRTGGPFVTQFKLATGQLGQWPSDQAQHTEDAHGKA